VFQGKKGFTRIKSGISKMTEEISKTAEEWTPIRIAALIALWEEGLPTSEIGRRLNVTKNAVVGKVHRLGLVKRQSPIRHRPKPVARIIRMENLRAGMCSWPAGEPGTDEFRFCGNAVVHDKPYCAHHCEMAYVRNPKDRKTAAA